MAFHKPMTQSLLSADPDERIVRWGWIVWIAWGVIGAALLIDDAKAGTLSFSLVLSAPFWALWLLWPLYRLARVWWRWQRESSWAVDDGAHYEFDGQRIRVFTRDDAIWFAADDVFDALGLAGRQRDAGRVRQIAGRDGLVRPSGSRLLAFSEIGIQAWLERRTDADAHKFKRWLDTQVIAPYRRRRQLDAD